MDVQVFLASWEIECCQPPPTVGDTVAWRLRWVEQPTGPGVATRSWQTTALAAGPDGTPSGAHLRQGAVSAWWPEPAPDAVPTRGWLLAEAHGPPAEVPPTVGTVISVRVVDQLYRRAGPGPYEAVADDFVLRAVERSPKRFNRGRTPLPCIAEPEPETFREESGVLVHLRVDEPLHEFG